MLDVGHRCNESHRSLIDVTVGRRLARSLSACWSLLDGRDRSLIAREPPSFLGVSAMRVLLALDGSSSADAARRAVQSLTWPSGSVIQVLGVVGPGSDSTSVAADTSESGSIDVAANLERFIEDAASALQAPGLVVSGSVAIGRAATVIVDVATEHHSELIIVGSRGRGPIASMLLGSVSAEVVDHAPCPVLVVRSALESPVIVAVDGSASADAAVTYLVANPMVADRPIHVVGVAHRFGRAGVWKAGGMSSATLEVLDEQLRAERHELEQVAARAVARLRAVGCHAEWSISEGHPADQIIKSAADLGCGLIVMGSRGMTGLKRIVIGSVARTVLLHAAASVLIVREPIRARSAEPVQVRALTGTLATAP
jgi:nucleotide-binding universal stress UspA family protein